MRIRDWRSMEGWRGKVRGGSFKRVWSRRNRGKIHKDTYYFKGPKKEQEPGMKGMGGGRLAPSVPPPHPPTAS